MQRMVAQSIIEAMDADPDISIRLAAFAAVHRLLVTHGGVVPWEAIARGFEHAGHRIHLATRPRGIFRPREMVAGALSVKTTVPRKGREARYADLADPEQAYMDYCFQGKDPDSRDNRLLERCRTLETPLIYFYGVDEGHYVPLWPVYVEGMDRRRLRARLVLDDQKTVPLDGTPVLRDRAGTVLLRRYQTIQARARLHQAAFSAVVMRAYGERCAICNLPKVRMLVEAAHIVPDADEQGHPDVRNGLALCRLHHAAFDAHLLGVRPNRVVEISARLLEEHDGPVLEQGIKAFGGRLIRVPRRLSERPGEEYLEQRYELFRAAG